MNHETHKDKNNPVGVEITAPNHWGNELETSAHIILTIGNEQRSQRIEDWNHSSDSFGALADIIPDTMRDTVESLIDDEILKSNSWTDK